MRWRACALPLGESFVEVVEALILAAVKPIAKLAMIMIKVCRMELTTENQATASTYAAPLAHITFPFSTTAVATSISFA
jgi:hypothetical protein